MIICKRLKTPYNANKWILEVLSKWEYGVCLLCTYISREFVFLWCTQLYIECFQCVIDKCYHYWLTSKIFNMVFAACGRTTVLYAIEFHATVFSLEYMFICSYIGYMNKCSYEYTFRWKTYEYMSIRSYDINGCIQFNCGTPQVLSYWEYFSVNQRYMMMSTRGVQSEYICTPKQTNAKKRQNTYVIKSCIFACMLVYHSNV